MRIIEIKVEDKYYLIDNDTIIYVVTREDEMYWVGRDANKEYVGRSVFRHDLMEELEVCYDKSIK